MRSRRSEYSARVAPVLAQLHLEIDHFVAKVVELALERFSEPRIALAQPARHRAAASNTLSCSR